MPFNRYKKTANNRKNELRRLRPPPLADCFKLDTWVMLPVDPNNDRGDLNAQPTLEVELRRQEADFTNDFLIEHNQPQRYEKKSDWLINKWKKKLSK